MHLDYIGNEKFPPCKVNEPQFFIELEYMSLMEPGDGLSYLLLLLVTRL
jgi:hypothetical protein